MAGVAAFLLTALPPVSHAGTVTLRWDSNREPEVSGYRLHYGPGSRQYSGFVTVLHDPGLGAHSATVSGLDATRLQYFAVDAFDGAGNQSGFSNEVSTLPLPEANDPEFTLAPSAPQGPGALAAGATATYAATGAVSNARHALQHRFSWGDGTDTGWLPAGVTTASKAWSLPGTYLVRAAARCATHGVVSADSPALAVTVSAGAAERVSTPPAPRGPAGGAAGTILAFDSGGVTSSTGDRVQYRFLWGDGTSSGWLPVGTTSARKSWGLPGAYTVRVEARCARHPSVLSPRSAPLSVAIQGSAAERVVSPRAPSGPLRGRAWKAYSFASGAASSSLGHPLLRRFHWGDGTVSAWTAANPAREWHAWDAGGRRYDVVVEHACSLHPEVSAASPPLTVSIAERGPLLLAESFRRATALKRRWARIAGRWRVRGGRLFSRSLATDGLLASRRVRGFFAGRVEGRFLIPATAVAEPGAGFVFSFESRSRYRYVAFHADRVVIGQVGDTPAQSAGVAASAARGALVGGWHDARVDLLPDGTVTVHLDGEELPVLAHRFGDLLPGRVGFVTFRSRAVFDDLRVWDATVLTAGQPAGASRP